jgi:hypothetical protein
MAMDLKPLEEVSGVYVPPSESAISFLRAIPPPPKSSLGHHGEMLSPGPSAVTPPLSLTPSSFLAGGAHNEERQRTIKVAAATLAVLLLVFVGVIFYLRSISSSPKRVVSMARPPLQATRNKVRLSKETKANPFGQPTNPRALPLAEKAAQVPKKTAKKTATEKARRPIASALTSSSSGALTGEEGSAAKKEGLGESSKKSTRGEKLFPRPKRAKIKREMRRLKGKVKRCVKRHAQGKARSKAIKVSLDILPQGRPAAIEIQGASLSAATEACVKKTVESLSFPAFKGEAVHASYVYALRK